jgi:hypothetical protein
LERFDCGLHVVVILLHAVIYSGESAKCGFRQKKFQILWWSVASKAKNLHFDACFKVLAFPSGSK